MRSTSPRVWPQQAAVRMAAAVATSNEPQARSRTTAASRATRAAASGKPRIAANASRSPKIHTHQTRCWVPGAWLQKSSTAATAATTS
jgi:hypothetical protein